MCVILPHAHEILRADYQCFQSVVVLEDTGDRRGHQRLAKPNHIADQDAIALVQVMGRYLHCGCLEVEHAVAEVPGNLELSEARTSLVRQVIGHFEIDPVRWYQIRPCPTLLDNFDQLFGDVHAELIGPPILEPLAQFFAGVLIEHIYVQFTLA